ncbi:MAG: dephospho-CoA kinase [Betaproteobacteria bacterium]|nr:MAG: dephospho-CoA kinase [Betaproteobacteria bacterium]
MRIGLTGGIGSGKSTVAALLVRQGAVLIDTDAIARALTGPGGAAMPALRARFGDAIVDAQGALDRERMRALAFADPAAKRTLEAVLHPVIGVEAERQAVQAAGAPVVFDVPLLVESGHWRAKVDRVLLVDCSEGSREAVQRVIASQASRSARRAAADAVIDNDALTLSELAAQVDTLWRAWRV